MSKSAVVLLVLLTFFLSGPALFLPGFADTDAAVHAMDGVFLMDFARAMPPPSEWRNFATDYYARHPALGIVAYPPLLSVVLAGVFAIVGISTFAARATVLAFAIATVILFHRWMSSRLSPPAALFASLLLAANAEFVTWSREVMLEVPALFFLVAAGFRWDRYIIDRRRSDAFASAIFSAAAVYAKQPAGFFVAVLVASAILSGGLRTAMRDRILWFAVALFAVLLIPLGIMTLKYGQYGTVQLSPSQYGMTYRSLSYWTAWIMNLPDVVHPVALAIAAPGLFAGNDSRRRSGLVAVAWIAVWFVIFSALPIKTNRFALLTVPPFCILAGIAYDGASRWLRPACWAGAALVLAVTFPKPFDFYVGSGDAASETAKLNSDHHPVLYDGYHNANFVFHMRDVSPHTVVLRGSKMITATASGALETYPIITTETGLVEMLNRYAVHYIAAEESPYLILAHTRWLRSFLRAGPFQLEKSIPIATNMPVYDSKRILIYRYLDARDRPETSVLEIFVPSAGMTVRADIL